MSLHLAPSGHHLHTPGRRAERGGSSFGESNLWGHFTPYPQTAQPPSLSNRHPGCLPQEAASHPAALMKLPRNWLISLFDYLPLIPFLEHKFSKNRTASVYLSIPVLSTQKTHSLWTNKRISPLFQLFVTGALPPAPFPEGDVGDVCGAQSHPASHQESIICMQHI